MSVLTCTHTLTQIKLYMWSISVSLPRCESLAIPDAGWSAEPAWPETIRDPRGGCTSQWALRPWLKHQPLSMQRWREEREGGGEEITKNRWRDWEFSSISCLCSWLKEGFVHHFMAVRRGGVFHLFFIAHNTPPPNLTTHTYCTCIGEFIFAAVTFKLVGLARVWDVKILAQTRRRACIRLQQPVDYHHRNVAISFDICGFDMYLSEGRFR